MGLLDENTGPPCLNYGDMAVLTVRRRLSTLAVNAIIVDTAQLLRRKVHGR